MSEEYEMYDANGAQMIDKSPLDNKGSSGRKRARLELKMTYAKNEVTLHLMHGDGEYLTLEEMDISSASNHAAEALEIAREIAVKAIRAKASSANENVPVPASKNDFPVVGYFVTAQRVVVADGETLYGAKRLIVPQSFFGARAERTEDEIKRDQFRWFHSCAETISGRYILGPHARVLDTNGQILYQQPRAGG